MNASRANDYCGVLLAAGKGSRMAALSEHLPKPMMPVGNKPLLVHQIELLRDLGVTDIVILIGHKGFEIARALGDGSSLGVHLRYAEQTEMLGIAHAVGQLESTVSKPFMLFLGDIFFIAKDLEGMFDQFEQQGGGAVLATKIENDPLAIRRNYSVQTDDTGRVVRVVEKPRHVSNKLKGVGLYLFDLAVFDAIRRTPRTAMRNEYEITEAIQVMINDGEYVSTVNAVHDDINVTFPSDVLSVNLDYARSEPNGNIISEDADVHPEARLENTIVGAGARITGPTFMRNCVVVERSEVPERESYENVIVVGGKVIACQGQAESA